MRKTTKWAVIVGAALVLVACSETPDRPDVQAEPADLRSPRMLELYTSYCPVCLEMEPLIHQLKDRCDPNGVRVETVDVSKERNEHLVDKYELASVPTFVFLDENGTEVGRLVGRQTEGSLLEALFALRGERCPDANGKRS